MTPERAKELLPIIEAFSKGAKIQFLQDKEKNFWQNTSTPNWTDDVQYRIKPQRARIWYDKFNQFYKVSIENNWKYIENLPFFGGWKSEPFDLTED